MTIDLHGFHPTDLGLSRYGLDPNGEFERMIRDAFEAGETEITFIHGHGQNRGISVGFVNTNTGFLGLCVRKALRSERPLRQWICHTTLDCSDMGSTTVRLKRHPDGSSVRAEYRAR